ncbi:MAG TPA: hypothetical protein VFX61_01630 [Micromonosporaceae bacterium]|nr:hypothetical protein [Micromonosporaceae bacterium]
MDDYLPDAGLKQLRDASDLVVLGHVVNTASGIRISEDPNVEYTILTVSVDEVLKGNAGKTVDVALLTHIRRAAVGFDGRPTPKRGDRGVWLLTAIAPEFKREGYVLTNQNSQLLVKSDGAGLIGGASSSPVAREIRELGGLPGVLNRLREASK